MYAKMILFRQKSTIKLQRVTNLVSESWMDVFDSSSRLISPSLAQPVLLLTLSSLIFPAPFHRVYGRARGSDSIPQSQRLVDGLILDSREKESYHME
jgi:hypothetical protein